MFNWYSAPTFAGMLLFWLLAAYIVTRSPRGPISLAAVAAQVATAAYLWGQGMQANASTLDEWWPWARNLQWGATIAPVCWYWLTMLLLREQEPEAARRYRRRIGYPLGVLFALVSLILTVGIYVDDWLYRWSAPEILPPDQATYFRFHAPTGPLYPAFVGLLAGTTIGAALAVWLGRHLPIDEERRQRFAGLLVSAVLFIVGATSLGLANWLKLDFWPTWVGHLILTAAMVVMAWNVAAYSLLLQGQVIRTDFLYFLTALGVIAVIYGLVFLSGAQYSFQLLRLMMTTLVLAILSHALIDLGRRILDRLFFDRDVQQLRSNLSSVVQSAALTPELEIVLDQAHTEIAEVSTEHLIRLTGEALRRLNNPAALARWGLIHRLPNTLAAVRAARGDAKPEIKSVEATPLEQAQALRETLTAAIERLKPPDSAPSRRGAPAALQYNILREEYLLGVPNRQIMTRHSISESTFHRNRREASAILARELSKQEDLLVRGDAGSF